MHGVDYVIICQCMGSFRFSYTSLKIVALNFKINVFIACHHHTQIIGLIGLSYGVLHYTTTYQLGTEVRDAYHVTGTWMAMHLKFCMHYYCSIIFAVAGSACA